MNKKELFEAIKEYNDEISPFMSIKEMREYLKILREAEKNGKIKKISDLIKV